MKQPPPWDRLLWGIVFMSRGASLPILIGHSWDYTLPGGQGILTFKTRTAARAWCKTKMEKWEGNLSLRTWRVRPVRVRERVEVVA